MSFSDYVIQPLRHASSYLPLAYGQNFPSAEQEILLMGIVGSVIIAVASFFAGYAHLSVLPVACIIFITAGCIRDLREHHNRMNQYEAQVQAQRDRDDVAFERLRIARQNVENALYEFRAKHGDTLRILRTDVSNLEADIDALVNERRCLQQELSAIERGQSFSNSENVS